MSVWESHCEDGECPRACHLSTIRSVSVSLFSSRLNKVAKGQREGYNSIPITLVGTVLPSFLICKVSVSARSARSARIGYY